VDKVSTEINISDNTFYDNSKAIGEVNDYSINWGTLGEDIAQARNRADTQELVDALNSLEAAVRKRDKASASKVVVGFLSAFTSTLFGNIASASLLDFVQRFINR
jgi:hypothetical protein